MSPAAALRDTARPRTASSSTCGCRPSSAVKVAATNPEQLFAIGFAACFESALGVVARRRKLESADVAIDSRVMLFPTEERGFKLAAQLDVHLPSIDDPDDAVEMVHAAHALCPTPTPPAATSMSR